MKLSAKDIRTFLVPNRCELRVWLEYNSEAEPREEDAFAQLLQKLGKRHEHSHLLLHGNVFDLSNGSFDERHSKTITALKQRVECIYQPVLMHEEKVNGHTCQIVGQPDFLLLTEQGYVIRDSKICKRIAEDHHAEIIRQLQLYGWLFRQNFGFPPVRLEVQNGNNDIIVIPDDNGNSALELFAEIVAIRKRSKPPYSPVGWTKCAGCPYQNTCWQTAEQSADIATVYGVDQNLARALRDAGAGTVDTFLAEFDEPSLANFSRPWGTRIQKVGKKAGAIITAARAKQQNSHIVLTAPRLPSVPNYVMFDLEGVPPQLDDLEKVYLWGTQVFGKDAGDYSAILAQPGKESDEEAWLKFLQRCEQIFETCGDIPFVHWHHYERTKIDMYVNRYGDRKQLAARVKANLLDLLPIAQQSVVLPVASYSLKVVEKYIGFVRSQTQFGGDWSIAKYIEATEIDDAISRDSVLRDILIYNEEDLLSLWAVFNWLASLTVTATRA